MPPVERSEDLTVFQLRYVETFCHSAAENFHFKIRGLVSEKLMVFLPEVTATGLPLGSGLIDRAQWSEIFHDRFFSADGANWKSASNDFTKGGKVGMNTAHMTIRCGPNRNR